MKLSCVLFTVLLGALVPAAPAQATNDLVLCTLDFEVAISPGLVPTPTTATYTTEGETGTVACQDLAGGNRVSRVGRLAAAGVVGLFGGATCSEGIGGGTFTFTFPTADGPTRVASDYAFSWAGPTGNLTGSTMSGTFELAAVAGNCVSAAITRARVHSVGIVQIR